MSKKSWLVAHREYVENLRTKAFWIGILLVPVLLVATIVIPMLLDRAKDVRYYAVVDESGWMLPEVERRAEQPDFEEILTDLHESTQPAAGEEAVPPAEPAPADGTTEGPPPAARAPKDPHLADLALRLEQSQAAPSAELAKSLDSLSEEELARIAGDMTQMLQGVARVLTDLGTPEGKDKLRALPKEHLDRLVAMRDAIVAWWNELPEKKHDGYRTHTPRGKFHRVEAPPGQGEERLAELNRMIRDRELFAYFVIPKDPVRGAAGSRYVSQNLTDESLQRWLEDLTTEVVREKRLDQESISPQTAHWLMGRFDFEAKKVGAEGKEEDISEVESLRQWAPIAFVYLLWLAIFSIAQMLLTNTIEEKSNRILEVLLSSVSPLELMVGKIAGIAMTGLTVVFTWVLSFILIVKLVPRLLGNTDQVKLDVIASDPLFLTSFIVYFLLGYLLFAALLVGIGSVCNSIKEANNLMMPVTVMLMLPLLAMVPISKDPGGRLAILLSYIPPFTPFVMMNRAAQPPSMTEYAITTALLIVAIVLAMWAAAKVFRIGVLMTGKAPTPREMLRWLKAPVGQVPNRESES